MDMREVNKIESSSGERAKRLPPGPRVVLSGMNLPSPHVFGQKKVAKKYVDWTHRGVSLVESLTLLPEVDDLWQPVKDRWVLPGCRVLTYVQLCALALTNGWAIKVVN